jgi:hypothetical protein
MKKNKTTYLIIGILTIIITITLVITLNDMKKIFFTNKLFSNLNPSWIFIIIGTMTICGAYLFSIATKILKETTR